jgi:hypothetical protein
MRRQDLEALKSETDERLRQAEAERLELANEEKKLQIAFLRQRLQGTGS